MNKLTVVIYNNNNADVIIDGKTLYVDRTTGYSFIRTARTECMREYWAHEENNDQMYIFVK